MLIYLSIQQYVFLSIYLSIHVYRYTYIHIYVCIYTQGKATLSSSRTRHASTECANRAISRSRCSDFRVEGLGFRVWGSGFSADGLRLRVYSSRFRV